MSQDFLALLYVSDMASFEKNSIFPNITSACFDATSKHQAYSRSIL